MMVYVLTEASRKQHKSGLGRGFGSSHFIFVTNHVENDNAHYIQLHIIILICWNNFCLQLSGTIICLEMIISEIFLSFQYSLWKCLR